MTKKQKIWLGRGHNVEHALSPYGEKFYTFIKSF
jgi:hypothetical protein